jgi:hypothetical protein
MRRLVRLDGGNAEPDRLVADPTPDREMVQNVIRRKAVSNR